jgi:hypothetical protein
MQSHIISIVSSIFLHNHLLAWGQIKDYGGKIMKTRIIIALFALSLLACAEKSRDPKLQEAQPGKEMAPQTALSKPPQETQPGRELPPQMNEDRQSRETQPRKDQAPQSDQDRQSQDSQPRREPPPQAYEDCKGKSAGETVQHMTREGRVAATCENTPQGLVARPIRRPNEQMEERSPQSRSRQPDDRTDERQPPPPPHADRNLTQ